MVCWYQSDVSLGPAVHAPPAEKVWWFDSNFLVYYYLLLWYLHV